MMLTTSVVASDSDIIESDLKLRNKFQVMHAVTLMDYEENGLEPVPLDHIADTLKRMCCYPGLNPDTKKHAQKLLKRVLLKEEAYQVQLEFMDKQDQGTSNHKPEDAGDLQDVLAQARQGDKEVVENSDASAQDKASA
jgi:hypothetical protein